MAEGFASRIGRIVSSSVNALIENVEGISPEMMMRETVREIESAIDEVKAEKGAATAEKYLAQKRLNEQNNKHSDIQEQIEIAIGEGRDDLAEAAIKKQMDIEAQFPILEQTISDAASKEDESDKFLLALEAKKREMLEEIEKFIADQKEVDAMNPESMKQAEKAVKGFEDIIQRHAKVAAKHGVNQDDKMVELEALARDKKVSDRLAALKQKQGS